MRREWKFEPDCPDCGKVEVEPLLVQVNLPSKLAREFGLVATFLARCPSCKEMFGDKLDDKSTKKLKERATDLQEFNLPLTGEIEPNYQPPLIRSDVNMFTKVLSRATPKQVFDDLEDPSHFGRATEEEIPRD